MDEALRGACEACPADCPVGNIVPAE
jgi:hypothetical protein